MSRFKQAVPLGFLHCPSWGHTGQDLGVKCHIYVAAATTILVEEPGSTLPPPPCISYANVRNCYAPYAHCSLAMNGGKFSDRSPPTNLCPLIQSIVSGTAATPPPQFIHKYGAGGAATVRPFVHSSPTVAWTRA